MTTPDHPAPTPRTVAFWNKHEPDCADESVLAEELFDFARTLETELQSAQTCIAQMRDDISHLQHYTSCTNLQFELCDKLLALTPATCGETPAHPAPSGTPRSNAALYSQNIGEGPPVSGLLRQLETELQAAQTQAEEYRQAGLRGLDRETAQQQRIAALEGELSAVRAGGAKVVAECNALRIEVDQFREALYLMGTYRDQLRAEVERWKDDSHGLLQILIEVDAANKYRDAGGFATDHYQQIQAAMNKVDAKVRASIYSALTAAKEEAT